jgi:hypothetical protein
MSPFDAAVEYHVRCERFDRTACTGPMGGDGILPANGREQAIINAHAYQVLSECARLAQMPVSEFKRIVSRHDVIEQSKRVPSATPFVPHCPIE